MVLHQRLPLSLGGDFARQVFDFIMGWFSRSTASQIEKTLSGLKFPKLDPTSQLFEIYDTFYGLGLLTAILVTAAYLFAVIRNPDVQTLTRTITVLPLTFLFGYLLPAVGYLLTTFVTALAKGMIEAILKKPYSGTSFAFSTDITFGLFDGLIAKIGAFILNLEFEVFSEHLILAMTAMTACFVLRWLGAFGDGLFVIATGLALMFIFGPFVSVAVLAAFWAGYSSPDLSPTSVMLPITIAGFAPILILVLYVKTGLSTKVRGVMDSKQFGTRAAQQRESQGHAALKAGAAGIAAGALGAAYLNRSKPKDDASTPASRRSVASETMRTAAGTLARTNPVTAAGLLMGSLAVKDKNRPQRPATDQPRPVPPPPASRNERPAPPPPRSESRKGSDTPRKGDA